MCQSIEISVATKEKTWRINSVNLIQNILLIFIHPHVNPLTRFCKFHAFFYILKWEVFRLWGRRMGLGKCGSGKLKGQSSYYGLSVGTTDTYFQNTISSCLFVLDENIHRIKFSNLVWNGQISEFWLLNLLMWEVCKNLNEIW